MSSAISRKIPFSASLATERSSSATRSLESGCALTAAMLLRRCVAISSWS